MKKQSQESYELQAHLREHFPKIPRGRGFSGIVQQVLKQLLKQVLVGKKFIKEHPTNIHETLLTPSTMRPLPSSTYMPDAIRNYILSMKNKRESEYSFSFDVHGRAITIYMLYPGANMEKAMERARWIYVWLSVAYLYAGPACSRRMNLYLYFTPFPKVLPKPGQPRVIEFEHANTAYTTACQPATEIYLYRDEEWFKVLIHETFHSLGLDFSAANVSSLHKKIIEIMPVDSEVNLTESYCEMWAEIMNVVFFTVFSEGVGKATDVYLSKIEERLQLESMFSVFQCVKVLHFFGLDYRELYTKDADSHRNRRRKYKEKTNVLAYYIIKAVFMFHSGDFIEWCAKNNKVGKVLNFDEKDPEKYVELFETLYRSPEFLEWIDKVEKWFSEGKGDLTLRTTMRMSVFEMAL
jgi:hypothetical protein